MRGFTLVELLIVVAVLMIITAITLPAFGNFVQGENLRQAAEQVLSDLRAAQSRSQTGVADPSGNNVCWGLRIPKSGDLTSYEVGYTSNCSLSTLETVTAPSPVKLPGGATDQTGGTIIFKRITGQPVAGVTIVLTLNSVTKTIIVEAGGNMYVQ